MIKAVVFPCTYRCDGRCIMCSIYERQTKDLPVSFFKSFFTAPEVKTTQSINISGGEPTIRQDLAELIQMITEECPQLRELFINTNGLVPERTSEQIRRVLDIMPEKVQFWVYVSLDALDSRADRVRGVKNASHKAQTTLEKLRDLKIEFPQLEIGVSCTITSANYQCLDAVYHYSKENQFHIDFIYATVNSTYINSLPKAEQFVLDELKKEEVIQFLERLVNDENMLTSRHYYQNLIKRIRGQAETRDCIFQKGQGLLLEADGTVRMCGMTEDSFLGDLNQEDLSTILKRPLPQLNEVCSQCETNSYFNWSEDVQKLLKGDLLALVKDRRREEREKCQ